MNNICIMAIGNIPKDILDYIAIGVEKKMGLATKILKSNISLLKNAFSISRKQFLASKIIKEILRKVPKDCVKVLGILDYDIYTPIFTFIFGQSQFNGEASVISLHRLRQEFYHLPGNEDVFFERALKESLHELGHNFGLAHCEDERCVMHFSNNVIKIDRKEINFCNSCNKYLRLKIEEIKNEN